MRIDVESHPPERRQGAPVTLACGCCCCCCCCLHSLGSVIGSAIAPNIGSGNRLPLTEWDDDETPDIRLPGLSATRLFWRTFAVLSVGGLIVSALIDGGSSFVVGVVLYLLAVPAIQLAAIFLVFLALAISSRADRLHQMKQAAKITLGILAGAFVGGLAMGLPAMFFLR